MSTVQVEVTLYFADGAAPLDRTLERAVEEAILEALGLAGLQDVSAVTTSTDP